MAKTDEQEAEQEEEGGLRSQVWKHELFVEWCDSEYGTELGKEKPATVISWFAAKRNEFRRSDLYKEGVASHANDAEEAKAARAEEREAQREAKAAEREKLKAAKAAKEAKAEKAPPAKRSSAKKAAPAKKASGRRGKATAGTSEDDPFS